MLQLFSHMLIPRSLIFDRSTVEERTLALRIITGGDKVDPEINTDDLMDGSCFDFGDFFGYWNIEEEFPLLVDQLCSAV